MGVGWVWGGCEMGVRWAQCPRNERSVREAGACANNCVRSVCEVEQKGGVVSKMDAVASGG